MFYPSIDVENKLSEGMREMSNLPVVIKERNVEYQLHRMLLFKHLLYVRFNMLCFGEGDTEIEIVNGKESE